MQPSAVVSKLSVLGYWPALDAVQATQAAFQERRPMDVMI
jgi:hypothetical protein